MSSWTASISASAFSFPPCVAGPSATSWSTRLPPFGTATRRGSSSAAAACLRDAPAVVLHAADPHAARPCLSRRGIRDALSCAERARAALVGPLVLLGQLRRDHLPRHLPRRICAGRACREPRLCRRLVGL